MITIPGSNARKYLKHMFQTGFDFRTITTTQGMYKAQITDTTISSAFLRRHKTDGYRSTQNTPVNGTGKEYCR